MSLTEEPTDEQINIALNLTGVEHLRNKSLVIYLVVNFKEF